MPFRSDNDAPWRVREGDLDEVLCDDRVPEMPAWMQDASPVEGLLAPPCGCAHCEPPEPGVVGCLTEAPESLAVQFQAEWKRAQLHTARAWRAAVAMHAHVLAERGPRAAEHVGSDLALMTGLHPRTGLNLMVTSLQAAGEVPELAQLVESGQLSTKHVDALLEEVCRWTDTPEQAAAVLRLTLDRARDRAAAYGWPTPGQLKKRLATAALLLDLCAAEKRKKTVHERRGVALLQTGAGSAVLTIEGPDVPLVLAYEAIRARAEAMGRLAGDERTGEQRMYDAALELLQVDADGGESVRPTTGLDGEPLRLVVRGVEVAVLTPYSITQGGNLELAEIAGYGPILPSTARELIEHADTLRRVAIDAQTGDVICVDDKVPGPARAHLKATAQSEDVEPDRAVLHPDNVARLQHLGGRPVIPLDLDSPHYRVPGRLRRHLEHRDRTCTFPGCHVPGKHCDVDHREPWPRGRTDDHNCHCLCRRHHRGKQDYFTVTLDVTTGDTIWTTPDGRTYRRPPPRW